MSDITKKAKNIKLVATDIDGVWTDARMYVTPDGDFMKAFSTYDGMAVSMLKKKGIIVAILTSENTDIVIARADKLKIKEVYVDEQRFVSSCFLHYRSSIMNLKLYRNTHRCQPYNLYLNYSARQLTKHFSWVVQCLV